MESERQTTKRLRQHSKKFFKYAVENANHKCSICGFGSEKFNFLHVHHIHPIKDYCIQFRILGGVPDPSFEMVNLIALCPNCHMIIHRLKDAVNDEHRKRLEIEIKKMVGGSIHLILFYSDRANLYLIARRMGYDTDTAKNIVLDYGLPYRNIMEEIELQEENII